MNPKQKTTEQLFDEKFDQKDYQKNIYSFSQSEQALLSPWDMQIQLGTIAERVLTGLLRQKVLKRLGTKNSPDVEICYDIQENRLCLYTPRNWCSLCQNKKAAYSVSGKIYCEGCVEILKKQVAAQTPPPVAKKEVKKPAK